MQILCTRVKEKFLFLYRFKIFRIKQCNTILSSLLLKCANHIHLHWDRTELMNGLYGSSFTDWLERNDIDCFFRAIFGLPVYIFRLVWTEFCISHKQDSTRFKVCLAPHVLTHMIQGKFHLTFFTQKIISYFRFGRQTTLNRPST